MLTRHAVLQDADERSAAILLTNAPAKDPGHALIESARGAAPAGCEWLPNPCEAPDLGDFFDGLPHGRTIASLLTRLPPHSKDPATPMTTSTTARSTSVAVPPGSRRAYAVSIGLSALFVVFQYFTSGEFIADGIPKDTRELWTTVHGFGAYPVMAFALLAAVIALTRLRAVRGLALATAVYFAVTVIQWLLGHAISTLGIDALTPVHVVVAAVVIGLAVWLSVRSARLRHAVD